MKSLFTAVAVTALFAGGASLAHAEHHMEKADKKDIVDTAASDDTFSTLVTAITEAELVEALKGDGPFTVFAPTNDAFAALPDGTLDSLLMDENQDQLQDILKLHVVSGKIKAGDIAEGTSEVETLSGDTITITKDSDGAVTVGGAAVISADVKASNGVIHVIDSVILPE
ncbi:MULTISPECIES: fasciclin domain-containing protein [Henriciella]|uniref:fasciclin domain-containing protein n=1 Tax=Henriciella TaxID=453849 RepID=UPI003514ACDE